MTADPAVPDRVHWAVSVLEPRPAERILEGGGGSGAAAQLICARLDDGTMHVIDRSAIAVERARERNRRHVDSGRLRVEQFALADLSSGEGSYDLAFALNVNVFWTHPEGPEAAVLHEVLAPGGRLAILCGPGPTPTRDDARLSTIARSVADVGFTDVRILRGQRGSGVLGVKPSRTAGG